MNNVDSKSTLLAKEIKKLLEKNGFNLLISATAPEYRYLINLKNCILEWLNLYNYLYKK